MPIITTAKQLRPRDPLDHYPTPLAVCRAALALIPDRPVYDILDPGAGTGPWGRAARERWPGAWIDGVEIDERRAWPSSYDGWHRADVLSWVPKLDERYDLVVGNPPYKHAEAFVRRGLQLAAPQGYVLFLLRLAFLEGQGRGLGLWRELPPQQVAVCSARPSFTGDGATDATAYALFLWQRGWRGTTALTWLTGPAEQHSIFDQEAA